MSNADMLFLVGQMWIVTSGLHQSVVGFVLALVTGIGFCVVSWFL